MNSNPANSIENQTAEFASFAESLRDSDSPFAGFAVLGFTPESDFRLQMYRMGGPKLILTLALTALASLNPDEVGELVQMLSDLKAGDFEMMQEYQHNLPMKRRH